jgi:hypothetical protein
MLGEGTRSHPQPSRPAFLTGHAQHIELADEIAETMAPSRGIVTKNRLGAPVLIRANGTFPGLPLLRGSSDVVWVVIAEATLCQRVGVALFERAILAAPRTRLVPRVHCAPRSLGGIDVSWTKACQCKSSGTHQSCAYHHLSDPMLIAPSRGI